MLAGRIYSMDYTLTVDLDEVAVVPWAAEGDGDSASPRLWQWRLNMARQLSSQCYLEDPNATCAMCWTTNSAGEEDLAACPLSILLQFDTALPQQLEEGRGYEVEYSLMIDTSKVPVVAMTPPGGMPAEITHANIHSW
eukprot:jgi/Tetstr1/443784/TSEL_031772.t1